MINLVTLAAVTLEPGVLVTIIVAAIGFFFALIGNAVLIAYKYGHLTNEVKSLRDEVVKNVKIHDEMNANITHLSAQIIQLERINEAQRLTSTAMGETIDALGRKIDKLERLLELKYNH